MVVKDWTRIRYFSEAEMRCKHTGQCKMDLYHMEQMDKLRDDYGKPIKVTSGYRHPSHPVEARKAKAGEHAYGMAADLEMPHNEADQHKLLSLALKYFDRVGISKGFIHVGSATNAQGFPSPAIWTYG